MASTMVMVFLASAAIALVMTLIDKKTVNPEIMKEYKHRLEEYKKKANQAREQGKVADMQRYQQMMMNLSQQQMGIMMRRMMYSMVVVLPAFWLLGYAYGEASVKLADDSGTWSVDGKQLAVMVKDSRIFIDGAEYGEGINSIAGSDYRLHFDGKSNTLKISSIIVNLPFSLPWFGNKLGWLGWYILSSLPASIFFRKLLGVSQ